jgi:hypothetical protein
MEQTREILVRYSQSTEGWTSSVEFDGEVVATLFGVTCKEVGDKAAEYIFASDSVIPDVYLEWTK